MFRYVFCIFCILIFGREDLPVCTCSSFDELFCQMFYLLIFLELCILHIYIEVYFLDMLKCHDLVSFCLNIKRKVIAEFTVIITKIDSICFQNVFEAFFLIHPQKDFSFLNPIFNLSSPAKILFFWVAIKTKMKYNFSLYS